MLRRILFHHFALADRINAGLRRHFSPAGQFLLLIMALAGVFGFNTKAAATYQLFTVLGAVFALALTWSLAGRRAPLHLTVQRRLPRYCTVGESLHYELVLTNIGKTVQRGLSLKDQLTGGYPDWREFRLACDSERSRCNVIDRWIGFPTWQWLVRTRRGASLNEQALADLRPGQSITLSVELTPLRRGRLQFVGPCLYRPDPFGLCRTAHVFDLPQGCCALPRRCPTPALPSVTGRAYQRGGVALANAVGDSEEILSLREYRHGDPLRSIHWRSSAKYGRWVVKEFQDEYFVRRALVLDTFCEGANTGSFETAVSVAASVAMSANTGDALLDLMFVEQQAHFFTAGRGLGQTMALLEVLAGVQPSRDAEFSALNGSVLRHAPALSSVVCVLLTWDAPRRRLVEGLLARGLSVVALLVGHVPLEGPPTPNLFVRRLRSAVPGSAPEWI